MSKTIKILSAILLILLLVPIPTFARGGHGGHFRTSIWIGPGFFPLWGFPAPYYYTPPPVIVQQPATEYYFLTAPEQKEQEPAYWYYCRKPEGYYPYVKQCPEGWMKVVPTNPGEQKEEK